MQVGENENELQTKRGQNKRMYHNEETHLGLISAWTKQTYHNEETPPKFNIDTVFLEF